MSVPVPAKQVLIPQYSIRWLLSVTTVFAVLFLVGRQAVRGSVLATAASFGFITLAAVFLVYATVFGVIWCLFQVFHRQSQALKKPVPNSNVPDSAGVSFEEP